MAAAQCRTNIHCGRRCPGDGRGRLGNHEGSSGAPRVVGIGYGGYYGIAARGARGSGAAAVGDGDDLAGGVRGGGDGLGAAVIGGGQTGKGDGGCGLVHCKADGLGGGGVGGAVGRCEGDTQALRAGVEYGANGRGVGEGAGRICRCAKLGSGKCGAVGDRRRGIPSNGRGSLGFDGNSNSGNRTVKRSVVSLVCETIIP